MASQSLSLAQHQYPSSVVLEQTAADWVTHFTPSGQADQQLRERPMLWGSQ
jgi:hypothetical protein